MATRTRRAPEQAPQNVGTLWTMGRCDLTARCALLAPASGWELRVLIDGMCLLAEQRRRSDEAFAFGDLWKRRLLDRGWRQVIPPTQRAAGDGPPP